MLQVKESGLLTTIQDLGRSGYQKYGVPPSGVIDDYSARVANILVGNNPKEALIEITGHGPVLEAKKPLEVSLTGGKFDLEINNDSMPMWESLFLGEGDIIDTGSANNGFRSYLAISGGIKCESVLGSKSTYRKGGLGGLNGEGNKLESGDLIEIENYSSDFRKRVLPEKYKINLSDNKVLRVVMGPQNDEFTDDGIISFLDSEYKVSNDSDRMGFRLEGPKIDHKSGPDIISDAISNGAIQVPGNGRPIIMLNDRQTTGGYAKIASVINEDLSKVAQCKPGDFVEFQKIDLKDAHNLYINREQKINYLLGMDLIEEEIQKTQINGNDYLISLRKTP